MASFFDELDEQLGFKLTKGGVPLPAAQQKPIVPQPLQILPEMRLPRPRPELGAVPTGAPQGRGGGLRGLLDDIEGQSAPFSAGELAASKGPLGVPMPDGSAQPPLTGDGGAETVSDNTWLDSTLEFFNKISPAAQIEDDVNAVARGWNRGQANRAAARQFAGISDSPEAAAKEVSQQLKEAESYSPSQRLQEKAREWEARPDGVLGNLAWLVRNPDFAGSVMAEGIASGPAGMAGAALGAPLGPAAMAGGMLAGGAVEAIGENLLEFYADKKGVDIGNEEQLAAAFSNKEWVAEAREYAAKQGLSQAAVDTAFTLLGGKAASTIARGVSKPAVKARWTGTPRPITGGTVGLGVEAIGGGAGEAISTLTTGDQIDWKNVVLESIGELGGGAIELSASAFAFDRLTGREKGGKEKEVDVESLPGLPSLPPKEVTPEAAELEGRTNYGIDDGSGVSTIYNSYEEAEAAMFEKGVRNGRLIAIKPEEVSEQVLDYSKIANLPYSERAKIKFQGDTDANIELQLAFNKIANNPKRRDEGIAQVGKLLERNIPFEPSVQGLDIFARTYRGPTRELGVKFKQIDYAGFSINEGEDLSAGSSLVVLPLGEQGDYDLDLKKLSPGTLVPSTDAIIGFVKTFGEGTLVEVLQKTGTDREKIEEFLSAYRSGERKKLLPLVKEIAFPPDPRLFWSSSFSMGVNFIGGSPEAEAEVKAALVKRPLAEKVRGKETIPRLWRGSSEFRTQDGKPGTIKIVDEHVLKEVDPKAAKVFKTGVEAVEAFMKRANLPFNVTIMPVTRKIGSTLPSIFRENAIRAGSYFWAEQAVAGYGTIVVDMDDPKIVKDPADVYRVIFHEFGHFLSSTGFFLQTPEVRTQLQAAYRRMVSATSRMPENEVMWRGTSFDRTNNPSYIFTFEEWFAEQIARWAITNRQPLGFVAKVAKQVARLLLGAAKEFQGKDPTNKFRAEPEIEKFLRDVVGGKSKSEWYTELSKAHEAETLRRNELALLGEDIGRATPMTPQSVDLRKMFGKVDEKELQVFAGLQGIPLPPLSRILSQVDRFNWFYKNAIGIAQIAHLNQHITPLQIYRELMQIAQVEKGNIITAAQDRMKEWGRQSKEQQRAIGEMLFWLTEMNYRTPVEVTNGTVRQPTRQEMIAGIRQFKLTRKGWTTVDNIRKDFTSALDRYMGLLTTEALKIKDPTAQADALADIQRSRLALTRRPYFPMTRYGKFALEVRDPQGKLELFELFESKRQRDVAFRRANKIYPRGSGYAVKSNILAEQSLPLLGVPPQMLDLISKHLTLSVQQKEDLEKLKFELAPAQSFRKRFLNRKEVEGWSRDAQRNYANYFFHHANHFIKVKYAAPWRDQIKAVETYSRGQQLGDKAMGIRNAMEEHLNEVLNPKADMAALRSVGAIYYLGLNAKSALMNMTQMAFATGPFLGAKFGDLKALNAMRRAMTDVSTIYKKETIEREVAAATKRGGTLTTREQELRALSEAMAAGIINESQAAELAAISEGSRMLAAVPGSDIARKWVTFSNFAMGMFSLTEQLNRRVSFRATWKLAMENPQAPWLTQLSSKYPLQTNRLLNLGWSSREVTAYLAGIEATELTQGQYAKWARPRFMRGRSSLIFMFYMFTQNMAFLGLSEGVKGSRVLPRMLLASMFLGGLMGLPGAEDVNDIIKALARMIGKDFDIDREVREMLTTVLGDQSVMVDLAMRGSSRYSFGISSLLDMAGVNWWPNIDMSQSVGMGRMLPINPSFLLSGPGEGFEKELGKGVVDAAGALFGIGYNAYMAAMDSSTPFFDIRRWERAAPSSLRGTMRAVRLAKNGGDETKRGEMVVPFDVDEPEHFAELVAMGLGFNPTVRTQAWEERNEKMEADLFWQTRRTMLMNRVFVAIRDRDREAEDEAMDDIVQFNEVAPASRTIKAAGLKRGIRQKLEDISEGGGGEPTNRGQVSVYDDIDRLYPEQEQVRKLKTLEGRR